MTTFILIVLTALLVLDALMLALLVIVQLPKKEAGVGMAFGGGTADALFGAGSGTALTNLTRNLTIGFFVLILALSMVAKRATHGSTTELEKEFNKTPVAVVAPTPTSQLPATNLSSSAAAATNTAIPLMISTNAAAHGK